MIYVYAVLEPDTVVAPVAGLDAAAVRAHEAEGLTLAVSEHDEAPAPTKEAVLRHAHVVEALARTSAPVLPARFGLAFHDESALRDGLGAQAAELLAALERVRGCAEVGLRVLGPEREEPTAQLGGAAYLRARLKETTERERLATQLHDVLTRHARESTVSRRTGGRLLLSAAYLVPQDGVGAFRREVGKLERSHPELALVCSGPWPPYSFAPRAEAVL
jgi:Gas vesicle synthesis protein GvpL/GvpF